MGTVESLYITPQVNASQYLIQSIVASDGNLLEGGAVVTLDDLQP